MTLNNHKPLTQHHQVVQKAIKDLNREISYLNTFSDILVVILYRIDGLLIKSSYPKKPSHNLLSILLWISKTISKINQELKRNIDSIKYLNNGIPVFFYKAGESAILATVVDPYSNYGLLQMELAKTADNIGKIITKVN
ncbi:MAG: hypothetical protein ACTSR2_02955 [Candidatus Hodarchaeales archaeon]